MSKLRTGPIFTQEILKNLIDTLEGQISSDQEDDSVFHEKVVGLQKFLHHGMSRFSIESLQNVLDSIVPYHTTSPPGGPSSTPPHRMEVKSIEGLRNIVKMVMMKKESGSIKASDADALKYIEHFFFAVYCMTEAKRLFDGVFGDLYFSYYKPEGESRQPTRVEKDSAEKQGDNAGSHTEDYSQFGITTLQQLTGSTHHKLKQTVHDMQNVLTRWAELLIQGEPDPSSFEPESEQDLMLLRYTSRTQPILRLLPDTFAKYYKCLELCKQWWVLAHQVYPELPFQRRPPSEPTQEPDDSLQDSELGSEKAELKSQQITETKEAIQEVTHEIEVVQEELDALSKREEKFEILMETYDKVGLDIEEKTRERHQLVMAKDRLSNKGNMDAQDREELDEAEAGIRRLDGSLKLLEFQHALLLQDYLIHMEIRPSIIRFQGEATIRLQDAQTQLEKHAETLERLEQELMAVSPESASISITDSTADLRITSAMSIDSDEPRHCLSVLNDEYDDIETHDKVVEQSVGKISPLQTKMPDITPNRAPPQAPKDTSKKNLLQKSNSRRQVVANSIQSEENLDAPLEKIATQKPRGISEGSGAQQLKSESDKISIRRKSVTEKAKIPDRKEIRAPKASTIKQEIKTRSNDQKGNVTPRSEAKTSKKTVIQPIDIFDDSKAKMGMKTSVPPADTTRPAIANRRYSNPVKPPRDLIPKAHITKEDTKQPRNRSQSDPPTGPADTTGPKLRKKSITVKTDKSVPPLGLDNQSSEKSSRLKPQVTSKRISKV